MFLGTCNISVGILQEAQSALGHGTSSSGRSVSKFLLSEDANSKIRVDLLPVSRILCKFWRYCESVGTSYALAEASPERAVNVMPFGEGIARTFEPNFINCHCGACNFYRGYIYIFFYTNKPHNLREKWTSRNGNLIKMIKQSDLRNCIVNHLTWFI